MSNYYCLHLIENRVVATTETNAMQGIGGLNETGTGTLLLSKEEYKKDTYLNRLYNDGVFGEEVQINT